MVTGGYGTSSLGPSSVPSVSPTWKKLAPWDLVPNPTFLMIVTMVVMMMTMMLKMMLVVEVLMMMMLKMI